MASNDNVDREGVTEFVCVDCAITVLSFTPVVQTERCMTCEWIANAPEADRPGLRAFLNAR